MANVDPVTPTATNNTDAVANGDWVKNVIDIGSVMMISGILGPMLLTESTKFKEYADPESEE